MCNLLPGCLHHSKPQVGSEPFTPMNRQRDASRQQVDESSQMLLINKLPRCATEREVQMQFEQFGSVTMTRIILFPKLGSSTICGVNHPTQGPTQGLWGIHIGNKYGNIPSPKNQVNPICLTLYGSMDGFDARNVFGWAFEDFKNIIYVC